MSRRKRNYEREENVMNNYLDNEELNEDAVEYSDGNESNVYAEENLSSDATDLFEWERKIEITSDIPEYTDAIVPVIGKTADDKVILDYNGYGIIADIEDKDVNKVTLNVFGEIGTPKFRFEVV